MSSFFREVLWTRLKRNRMAMAGALIVPSSGSPCITTETTPSTTTLRR